MVHIEIENRYAFRTSGSCFECGNGNRVKIAKAHRLLSRSVVTRRPHQTENGFTRSRVFQRIERSRHSEVCNLSNTLMIGRIRIEIPRDL
jgi:hypothetical protein